MIYLKIGIDFDRTLFDTDGFKEKLEKDFPGFSDSYTEAKRNGIYKPGRHAELVGVELQKLFDEFREARKFVYDDIEKLEKLKNKSNSLVLVSRGDKEFQRIKIKSSGIQELFDKVAIISKPLKTAPKDKVVEIDLMIDDRREELEAIDIPGILVDPDRKETEKVIEAIEKGKEIET